MESREEKRPSVISEVRAWLVVSIVIMVHTVGITWWGATIAAKVDSLKENSEIMNQGYRELELRVRILEREASAYQAKKP